MEGWTARLLAVVTCLLFLTGCRDSSESGSKASSAVLPDAGNSNYSIEGATVTLINGQADQPAAPGSASRNVTKLSSFTASGDLDGDGVSDAAVVLINSPGGSGTFSYVASFLSLCEGSD